MLLKLKEKFKHIFKKKITHEEKYKIILGKLENKVLVLSKKDNEDSQKELTAVNKLIKRTKTIIETLNEKH